jgi:hypothetical protein
MKFPMNLAKAILLIPMSALLVAAQDIRVEVSKRSSAIPKACEQVVPAKLGDEIDLPALVKEAFCKGSGDMLGEYSYATSYLKREKLKSGTERQETGTYEVFFPTLKGGTHTKGITVFTSHNGVPVSEKELEKVRARAAERTEKEEGKIAREAPTPPSVSANSVVGMLPLGSYARMGITHESFGRKHGVRLAVHTFLKNCDLTLVRRGQVEGRETFIFTFAPHPGAQLGDDEKYIAQLTGEIWIDVADRIVTRLVGWPSIPPMSQPASATPAIGVNQMSSPSSPSEKAPAVFVEMIRLPQQGIWLPRVTRINGADYPALFDAITTDSMNTYSNYIRFSTEVQDVDIGPPKKP